MKKIKGKHIIAYTDYYLHHGIGISKEEVVCNMRLSMDTLDTKIVLLDIDRFLRGGKLISVDYPFLINSKDAIINNAVNSIGIQPGDQDTIGDSFAYWCMTGSHRPVDSQIFGQHLYVRRGLGAYTHHGIGIENNMVVHYGDPSGGTTTKENAMIHPTTFDKFADGEIVRIQPYFERLPLLTTRNRAISAIGQSGYDVVSSNCEHFATWCVSGVKHSKQVKSVENSLLSGFKFGITALVVGALIGSFDEED